MKNIFLVIGCLLIAASVWADEENARRGVANEFGNYLPILLEQSPPTVADDTNVDGLVDAADPLFIFLNPDDGSPGTPVQFRITPSSSEEYRGLETVYFVDALDRNGRLVNPGTPGRTTDTISFTATLTDSASFPGGGKLRQFSISNPLGRAVTVKAGSGDQYTLTATSVKLRTGTTSATLITGSSILGNAVLDDPDSGETPAPPGTEIHVYGFNGDSDFVLEKTVTVSGLSGGFLVSGLSSGLKLVVASPDRSGNKYYDIDCSSETLAAGSFAQVNLSSPLITTTSTLQGSLTGASFGELRFETTTLPCGEVALERDFETTFSGNSYSTVLPAGDWFVTAEGFNGATQQDVFNFGVEATVPEVEAGALDLQLFPLTVAENVCPDFTRTNLLQSGFQWTIPETGLTGPVEVRLHSRMQENIWIYQDEMDAPGSDLSVQEVAGTTEFILDYTGPALEDNQIYFWEMTARSPVGKPYSLGGGTKTVFHQTDAGNGCAASSGR